MNQPDYSSDAGAAGRVVSQRQRGTCPVCHRRQRLTRDGRLGAHWGWLCCCAGEGRLPEGVPGD